MRTDCTRDNRATKLPNASHLGYDLWKAKRGNWIRYRTEGAEGSHGRVLGRVHCEGETYVEIIALLGNLDCPAIRWIKPSDIVQCRANPPRAILEWICGEWNVADVMARVEYGYFPKGED